MENLINTVKCIECHLILQSPIALPCGKSICQKHIDPQISQFYCKSCGFAHVVPKEGFIPNVATTLLIDLTLAEYKKALQSCQTLSACVDELTCLSAMPEWRIVHTIAQLKKEVRSKRDELIKEIEQQSDQILLELDVYEREAKNFGADFNGGGLAYVHKEIEMNLVRTKTKLNELQDELNNYKNASEEKWKSIVAKSELETNELTLLIDQTKQKFLFLNKFDNLQAKNNIFFEIKIPNIAGSEYEQNNDPQQSSLSDGWDSNLMGYVDLSQVKNESCEFENVGIEENDTDVSNMGDDNFNEMNYQLEDNTASLNNNSNSTRLNDEEVELIYNSGAQTLKSFAGRLFKRYFTSAELSAEDISFCGSDTKKPLDPIRIDFIKSHLVDRTQGQLTEMEWYECKRYLYILLFNARKGAGLTQKRTQNKEYVAPPIGIVRLSDDDVRKVYNCGDKAFPNFACRLMRKYFSINEMAALDGNFGALDPVRIGFIKNHLDQYNGGPISSTLWSKCKTYIRRAVSFTRKKYSKKLETKKQLK